MKKLTKIGLVLLTGVHELALSNRGGESKENSGLHNVFVCIDLILCEGSRGQWPRAMNEHLQLKNMKLVALTLVCATARVQAQLGLPDEIHPHFAAWESKHGKAWPSSTEQVMPTFCGRA